MAPVKTEGYQNNGALSSPVHAYACAAPLLSLEAHAMAVAFQHTVTEGQVLLPKPNFLLLASKTLDLYLRQSVYILKNDEKGSHLRMLRKTSHV